MSVTAGSLGSNWPITQLWGAALPLNTLGEPCTMEWEKRLGVCGDWLLGSGVQDAALSGFAMAERILDRNARERRPGPQAQAARERGDRHRELPLRGAPRRRVDNITPKKHPKWVSDRFSRPAMIVRASRTRGSSAASGP